MKTFLGVAGLMFVAAIGWRIGGALSADALGMALGIVFGMLAGVPAALMALSIERRHTIHTGNASAYPDDVQPRSLPPLIIVNGAAPSAPWLEAKSDHAAQPGIYAQQGSGIDSIRPKRQFMLIGDETTQHEVW